MRASNLVFLDNNVRDLTENELTSAPILSRPKINGYHFSSESVFDGQRTPWHVALSAHEKTIFQKYGLLDREVEIFRSEYFKPHQHKIFRLKNKKPKVYPSCEAAPSVRGTPLGNELKSLILDTSKGEYVIHLPGDHRLSLQKVKKALGVKKASLMAPGKLPFPPGRICALIEPISGMPSLVCDSLFTRAFLTTNDSTINSFFLFNPSILQLLPYTETANISLNKTQL